MKKENAITLIALVITIIILLILAGISIAQLTGNGLFEKAKLAKEASKNAQEDEDDKISQMTNEINGYINSNRNLSDSDVLELGSKIQSLYPTQSFTVNTSYTITEQNCYYEPLTKHVHVYAFINNINASKLDSPVASVPTQFKPNSKKSGSMFAWSTNLHGGIGYVDQNGGICQGATSASLVWVQVMVDYYL